MTACFVASFAMRVRPHHDMYNVDDDIIDDDDDDDGGMFVVLHSDGEHRGCSACFWCFK